MVQNVTDSMSGPRRSEGEAERDREYRFLFENSLDAVILTRPDGTILEANPAAQGMFGMTEDELRAAGRDGIIVRDEQMEAGLKERSHRGTVRTELTCRRKDGTTFPGEVTSSVFTDVDGTVKNGTIIRDIGRWKRAEVSIRSSEEQFRRSIEDAPIPVIMQAEDGEVLQISKTWTELTGYTIGDIRRFDEWITKAVYGEGANKVRDHLHDLFDGNKRSINVEFDVRPVDGELRHWSFSASSPGTLEDGRRFIVGMAVDVTDRKRAEDAVREGEEKYRLLFENMTEMFQVLEPKFDEGGNVVDFRYLEVNRATELFSRKSKEEIIGRTARELWGVVENYWFDMLGRVLRTGEPQHMENYSAELDYYYDLNAWKVDEHRVAIVFSNITEFKRAQHIAEERTKELAESEAKYRSLFDSIDEGFCIIEMIYDESGKPVDYRFLESNPAFEKHTGIRQGEKRTMREIEPNHEEFWFETYGRIARTGMPERFVHEAILINGWYEVYAFRLGEGNRVAILFSNITERKRAEENLKRSNDELQQFAYVASHDLQEPLRMVTSYIGLLNKKYGEDLPAQAKEYMSFAVDGSMRMKALIDDLLAYSRVESRTIELSQVDMNEVARSVLNELRIPIREEKAEVIIEPLPTVCADRTQMKQLLTNLISNAIKFHNSEAPRIEVSVGTHGKECVFAVKDNGIGIDPRFQDKLFKMFSRLHTREEYPGTGIGLAIAKRIVERYGGRIWFESEVGKGTTFYFALPPREG